MVARVHHATIAKATKLGFIIEGDVADTQYTIRWPERNRAVYASVAAQGVTDMALLKTLTVEYPAVKAVQSKGVWTVRAGGETFKAGTLEAAWDDFTQGADADTLDALADETEDDETEADEDGDEPTDDGRSVVKRTYKQRYRPFKMTCGDDLSQLITAHVTVIDPATKVKSIDVAKLRHFAKVNDCWQPNYAHLNPGMQRMNVANRLRAKVRRDGYEVIWS